MNWLLLHDIYFEWDRTDKRTSGKKSRADFRICFKGRKKRRRRVICLYLAEHNVIVLATLYKKSKRETLMEDEKRSLKQAAHTIKARFKLG